MSEQLHSLHEEQDPRMPAEERHLQRLLAFEEQKPWILTFFDDLKEFFFPAKQPPLKVSARPLKPEEIGAGAFIYTPALDETVARPARRASSFQPGQRVDSEHLDRIAHTGEEIS